MKKGLLTLVVGALIGGMIVFPFSFKARAASTHPTQIAYERYPEIDQALGLLNQANGILQNRAASDFGGHKVAAIQAINQAIGELHAARHWANHH